MDKNEKVSKNIIWIVWDILLKLSKQCSNEQLQKVIHILFELFTIKYMVSYNKKRIHQIYHVIELLLLQQQVDFSIELLKERHLLSSLDQNINVIFEQIKKHEVSNEETPKSKKEQKMDMYQNIYNNL
tara:strand:+ start:4234 stop:4617 length:384 start_codon:yes stop_codon:yes gene_type:complete